MALRRVKAPALALALAQAFLPACSTTSAPPLANPPPATASAPGSSNGQGSGSTDPMNPGYVPAGGGTGSGSQAPQGPAIQTGPTVGQRATSALNGMLMGAIIGGQAGPFGAAAGAAIFLVYSAVTGNVPLMGGGGGGYGYPGGGGGGYGYPGGQERDREQSLEDQIQNEEQRQASLESEIEEEQKRQDELLKKIDGQGTPQSAKVEPIPDRDAAPTDQELREQSDPRMAPSAPKERSLPASVYQEQKIQVAPGKWGNDKPLEVKRRSLDADRDGKSEEIVYVDARSGQILRKENDLDYDGTTDAWSTYQNGMCVAREVDSDRNGKIDTWETYAGGRMQSREVDRNGDGVRDAFFRYDGDSLAEERHDGNNDGQIDLVITYAGRHRVRSEEDANKDGKMDVWTTFSVGDGSNEVITRIEKDQKGTGKADTFETYVQQEGRAVLSSREEDVNGDGQVDVKSSYENGKLKNREISDPSLVPL